MFFGNYSKIYDLGNSKIVLWKMKKTELYFVQIGKSPIFVGNSIFFNKFERRFFKMHAWLFLRHFERPAEKSEIWWIIKISEIFRIFFKIKKLFFSFFFWIFWSLCFLLPGWAFYSAILGIALTFVCAILSAQAEKSTASDKVQDKMNEGKTLICLAWVRPTFPQYFAILINILSSSLFNTFYNN